MENNIIYHSIYLINNKNRFEPIEMNDNVKSKIDNTTQSKQPSIL